MTTVQLLMIGVGAASAVLTDVQAFAATRAKDPKAKFDFVLLGTRAVAGALTGFIAAVGIPIPGGIQ